MIRKKNIVNDHSNANYEVGNEILYDKVPKSNIWDYNDAYILVRGNKTIAKNIAAWVAFKNCVIPCRARFIRCITKID